jgi:murein DD-endopeptidase MepM/ murein hydrolase activator NlpD
VRGRRLLLASLLSVALAGPPALAAGGGHVFPVKGQWTTRGPVGEFGAPRNGGRVHEGFDVVAKCGAKLVSVADGEVIRRGYDPVLYGNFILIDGDGERRNYFYAHLSRPAPVKLGQRLTAGEFVGSEGKTGNAETVGCHLHFEIRSRGHAIDPEPLLRKWDRRG